MKIEKTLNEIAEISIELEKNWENWIKTLTVPAKTSYNLVKLRKTLSQEFSHGQEAVRQISVSCGGERAENGGFTIPDENIGAFREKMTELGETTVELDFDEIVMNENDVVSPELVSLLFDFIAIK